MHTILNLKNEFIQSPLGVFSEQLSRGQIFQQHIRPLNTFEIQRLQAQGNICENWESIMVEPDFTTDRIHFNIFRGKVLLPHFFGTVLTPGGVSVPTGIYRSTIADSIIDNSHIQDVSLMSGVIVAAGATLQNVGSVVASGITAFGTGKNIAVGNEMGGREIKICADLPWNLALKLLLQRGDLDLQNAYSEFMEQWVQLNQHNMCYVGKGVVLCNTNIVRNAWIGDNARIDGATKLRNAVVYSSLEFPTEIFDGVILEGAQVQAGTKIHSFAQIRDSILFKQSRVGRNALVSSSLVGSFCHIEEAEVTASLVGPLTQLHHHSLLIGALWPQGRGNVGYGANVGSNHTGKMPDQELLAGEGVFFGLGCSVKFPTNLQQAPYSIIATEVCADPQKMTFPFSLICKPQQRPLDLNQNLNELIPAWQFIHNAFALERNFFKYQQRVKNPDFSFNTNIFNADLAQQVVEALETLKNAPIKDIYTAADIPGIGSNFMRASTLQNAILAYKQYLLHYGITGAMEHLEQQTLKNFKRDAFDNVKRLFQGDLLKEIYNLVEFPHNVPALVRKHRTLEKRWQEQIAQALQRDFSKGREVFDDYDLVHPPLTDFAEWCKNRFETERIRCNNMLKALKLTSK